MGNPILITPAQALPISLEDIKRHLRVDHGDEDLSLTAYIEAATNWLEGLDGILGKVLVTQVWQQAYPGFTDPLPLPENLVPVSDIELIQYVDEAGDTLTLSPDVYQLVANVRCPYITLKPDQLWPTTAARSDAVTVEFSAGYGKPEDVPAAIRQSIRILVGDFYANREASSDKSYIELPYAVRMLLGNFRQKVM